MNTYTIMDWSDYKFSISKIKF